MLTLAVHSEVCQVKAFAQDDVRDRWPVRVLRRQLTHINGNIDVHLEITYFEQL
jgi:hypothetical protein